MADVIVNISGVLRRNVEAALGYELEPISASGDLFRVPEEIAAVMGDLPDHPPRASQSERDKRAVQAFPVEPSKIDAEAAVAGDAHDAVVGASKESDEAEEAPAGGDVEATPAAAELADEKGVNLSEVEGSGADGKVTKADVEAAA